MSSGKRGSEGPGLSVGQLRRHIALESEAVYRVLELGPATIMVEVIRAPGLSAGLRFDFTREAVLAMELVGEDEIPVS